MARLRNPLKSFGATFQGPTLKKSETRLSYLLWLRNPLLAPKKLKGAILVSPLYIQTTVMFSTVETPSGAGNGFGPPTVSADLWTKP